MGDREKLTREDARMYLERFPPAGWGTFAFNAASLLAGNSVVLWMMLAGTLRAAHLVALVLVESVLLALFAWAVHALVPRSAWLDQPKPWRERLTMFAFMIVWLGGAYGITLTVLRGWGDFLELWRSPQPWIDAKLHWALGVTVVLAIVHGVGDVAHWRARGGKFLSSVSHDAAARWLTLIFGAIPFAMPFFVVTIGAFKGIELVAKRFGAKPGESIAVALLMLAAGYGGFAVVGKLISSEVQGWAIGFVLAKLVSELLVAAIPLVMTIAAKGGGARARTTAAS